MLVYARGCGASQLKEHMENTEMRMKELAEVSQELEEVRNRTPPRE